MKQGLKILVITTWEFHDALVQNHTLPYLKIIQEQNPSAELFLLTEEKNKQFFENDNLEGLQRELKKKNITLVPHLYHRFGLRKLLAAAGQYVKLSRFVLKNQITHIHCFSTAAGGLGYLLSSLTGKSLVVDSYEPHAEAMVENGTWKKDGFAFKLLWWLEKKQAKRAKALIAIASGMSNYVSQKYGIRKPNIYLKPCCINLEQFQFNFSTYQLYRQQFGLEDKVVAVYAGKFGGIYLDEEVFDFFKVAYQFWGEKFRVLLLTTLSPQQVEQYCETSGVPFSIFQVTKAPFEEMPKYLSVADFGFTPVKPVPSKRYCSPIKDGEYWAMGLPVVITKNISDDSDIIQQHDIGAVIESLDEVSYRRAVEKIDTLLKQDSKKLRAKIRKVAEQYRNFDIARQVYRKVYTEAPSRNEL